MSIAPGDARQRPRRVDAVESGFSAWAWGWTCSRWAAWRTWKARALAGSRRRASARSRWPLVTLVGLVLYELRRREPLIEMRFFRSAPFSGATLVAVIASQAFSGFLFLNSLYLQEVRGYSPPGRASAGCRSRSQRCVLPAVGRLLGAAGPRAAGVAGGSMVGTPLLLTRFPGADAAAWCSWPYGSSAWGWACEAADHFTAVSGMPRPGAAGGGRRVHQPPGGRALGVAVTGSILGAAVGADIGPHLTAASHPAWWLVAGCGALVVALGVGFDRTAGARLTAQRCAEQLEREAAEPRPLQPASSASASRPALPPQARSTEASRRGC